MKISVIGCGAWGTAIAKLLGEQSGEEVCLWVRPDEEFQGKRLVDLIKKTRVNEKYLPGFSIPEDVGIIYSLKKAVSGAKIVISAVPSEFLREVAGDYKGFIDDKTVVVSVTKGVEYNNKEKKFMRMSEVLEEALEIPYENIVALSGPNIASEIAVASPSVTVVAGTGERNVRAVQGLFKNVPFLKVYLPRHKTDIAGVELGGALKNPYSIGGGIVHYCVDNGFLKIQHNSAAALFARSLSEMVEFASYLGAKQRTVYGASGVGDLKLCFDGPGSRNFKYGYALAERHFTGNSGIEIRGVVEGVRTLSEVHDFVHSEVYKGGCDINIMGQLYSVVHEKKPIESALRALFRGTEVE